jgi:hypothetical protein
MTDLQNFSTREMNDSCKENQTFLQGKYNTKGNKTTHQGKSNAL